jgi:hypothetical protein
MTDIADEFIPGQNTGTAAEAGTAVADLPGTIRAPNKIVQHR